MTAFVDFLHRDEFSLKHALGNSKSILKILKERNQTHFVVSNYGEISNWVQQLFTCKDNGIIPILGMETFINNFRYEQLNDQIEVTCLLIGEKKNVQEMDETSKDLVTLDYPLDIFARTLDGYYNIIKIHNDAQLNGVDKRPRTSDVFLKNHGKGIICILQTPYSEVGSLLFNGMEEEAFEKFKFYKEIFDDVLLSVSMVDDSEYSEINDQVIKFADKYGIKVIPVCNSHFIHKEDEDAWHTVMKLSRMRSNAFTYEIDQTPGLFYRTQEQVDELFYKHFNSSIFTPEKYKEIKLNLNNLLNEFKLLDINYDLKLPKFENGPEKLREKAWAGFKKKGYDKLGKKYEDRLNYELDNIIGAGFADYFLVLEEMFTWYRDVAHGMTAFGRGSAAGSLVLNCIGCTNIDPLKYNLLFERFLDAERFRKIVESGGKVSGADCPDVDSDVATNKRDAVKEHLVEKYGKECTASIGTIGTMGVKSTLRDLARLYEVPAEVINDITAHEMKGYEENEENPDTIEDLKNKFPGLRSLLEKYPKMADSFEKLKGSITNWGTHAGGVLITDINLFDNLPVRLDRDGRVVTTWQEGIAGRELGQMGFIKFDILAIDQLNVIEHILQLIKENEGVELDPYEIPFGDFKALDYMNKKDGLCIFQFDTELAGKVVSHMKGIRRFEDLSALSTLMRPASLQNGFDKEFGRLRDNEKEESVYLPECLKPYLEDTYGLPIYQEHIMQAAMAMAGFDKVNAYKFMKLIYKGKLHSKEEKDEWRKKFVEGCKPLIDSGDVREDFPDKFFDEILAFLGYGFCKCLGLDSILETPFGEKKISEIRLGDMIKSLDESGNKIFVKVQNIFESKCEVYEIELENGYVLKSSLKHKYLCVDGEMHSLEEIWYEHPMEVIIDKKGDNSNTLHQSQIISCRKIGIETVRDIEVDHPLHQFFANGIMVSNSHAVSYAAYSAIELWLKAYYPLEFMCANLSITGRAQEKKGISLLDQRVKYCKSLGFNIYPPDVRYAGSQWQIHDNGLMAPLINLKGFGTNDFETVVKNRPYESFSEFCEKTQLGRSKIETLIFGGAVDCFGDREYLFNWYSEVFLCKSKKKKKAQMDFFEDDEMEDQFEIKQKFSPSEINDMFFDLNGFSIQENLLLRFSKWLADNQDVKTIEQVISKKTAKHVKMFCKIVGSVKFTSKSGNEFVKLTFSDGVNSTDTVIQNVNYKRFKKTLNTGNIIVLPIQITDNGFYLEDLEKKNAIVLESES